MSEPSKPGAPKVPVHRFQPGQEQEAAAFVARPSRFETFKVLAFRRAVLGLYLAVPFGALPCLFGFVAGRVGGFEIALTVIFGLMFGTIGAIFVIKGGYFILDPEQGVMILGDRETPLSEIHDPEVTVRAREIMSTQWHPMTVGEMGIQYSSKRVFSGKRTVLSGSGFSTRRLERIATLMGEMADEWREKDAVRRWLAAQRSREAWEEKQRNGAAAGIDLTDLGKLLDG